MGDSTLVVARPGGRKTYGNLVAVDDVSFSVAEGEIFGILGPNGAGKTTTVECAIGLRSPDSGTIRLLGLDPHADRKEMHEIVGVQLQAGALPAKLRVGEILEMYRSFYRDPADVGELTQDLSFRSAVYERFLRPEGRPGTWVTCPSAASAAEAFLHVSRQ